MTAVPTSIHPGEVVCRRPALLAGSPSEFLHVVAWEDPVVDTVGIDPRARYVERFWLPVLGPSSVWLVRRLAEHLEERPDGTDVALATLARSLGIGGTDSKHAPLLRALRRCERFGLLQHRADHAIALRRRFGPLPRHHLVRLPVSLQAEHRRWEERVPESGEPRRRARLLADDLATLGEGHEGIERRLLRWGVHPALAYEAATWAEGRRDG